VVENLAHVVYQCNKSTKQIAADMITEFQNNEKKSDETKSEKVVTWNDTINEKTSCTLKIQSKIEECKSVSDLIDLLRQEVSSLKEVTLVFDEV
jgi:hypothetical protein